MFFKGTLTIDPSELTKIERVKPQKAFKRMLYFMTSGKISDQEERETFTAISILQQLNGVFLRNSINNLVRLAHDDIDIYFDQEGKKNDLKDALDVYEIQIGESMSHHFETLQMVLEHDDDSFKYLIEIRINKNHAVGAYPIEIDVSGFLKEFKSNDFTSELDIKANARNIFLSKEKYSAYLNEKKALFEGFMNLLKMDIMKFIKVDDVKVDVKSTLVLSKDKKEKTKRLKEKHTHVGHPSYYYGFNDYILYTWLWTDMCYQHGVDIDNVEILSEDGEHITDIGDESVNASEADLLNPDVDYDSRTSSFGDEGTDDYHDTLAADSSDSGGWFGSSDSDSGDSSSCSSCGSSCSSCSSCGGCS
ncbi:MAG: hypothetical protein COA38_19540 [Fluviicola sp.]|nr:MAG: hypothetical protein COA38_19540 [Fluviicola sp.]